VEDLSSELNGTILAIQQDAVRNHYEQRTKPSDLLMLDNETQRLLVIAKHEQSTDIPFFCPFLHREEVMSLPGESPDRR